MRYRKRAWGLVVLVGWVAMIWSGCFTAAGDACQKGQGDCFEGEQCVSGTCQEVAAQDSGADGEGDVEGVEPDVEEMPDGGDVRPDVADRPTVRFVSPRAGATVAAHRDVVVAIGGEGGVTAPVLTADGKKVGTMTEVSGSDRRYEVFWEMNDPSDDGDGTGIKLRVKGEVGGEPVEQEITVIVDCKGDFYPDADRDGYGAGTSEDANERQNCGDILGPQEEEVRPGDCNDNQASVYPGASEWCDGLNNDCQKAPEPEDCNREMGLGDIDTDHATGLRDTEVLDVAVVPGRGIVLVGRTRERLGQVKPPTDATAGFVGFLPRWRPEGNPTFKFRRSGDLHSVEEFRAVEITESGRAVVLGSSGATPAEAETAVLVFELTDIGPERVDAPMELFSGEQEAFLARDLTLGRQNDTESFYLAGRAGGEFAVDGRSGPIKIGSPNGGVGAVFFWSDLKGGAPDAYYGEERTGLAKGHTFNAIDYDKTYAPRNPPPTPPVGVLVAGSDRDGVGFYRGLKPYDSESGSSSQMEMSLTTSATTNGLYAPSGTDSVENAYHNMHLADVAALEDEGYVVGRQRNDLGGRVVLKGVGFFVPLSMRMNQGGEVAPWDGDQAAIRAIAPYDETRLSVTATVPVDGSVGTLSNKSDGGVRSGRFRCAVGHLYRRDASERPEDGGPSGMSWLDWEPREDDLRAVDCLSIDVSRSTGWGAVGAASWKGGVLFTRNL